MLLKTTSYFLLSATLIYILNFIYDFIIDNFKEDKNIKQYDSFIKPKEEYSKILDSVKQSYEQKQALINSQLNSNTKQHQQREIQSINRGGFGSNYNSDKTQTFISPITNIQSLNDTNLTNEQRNMKNQLMQYIQNKRNDTRKNMKEKEIIMPTENITIKDETFSLHDYETI